VSSRPLERLPTIRAKLGSTIIFAVGMTVILIFLMLGYALRKSSQDTDRLTLLRVARRAAAGTLTNTPGEVSVIRTTPDGASLTSGGDAPALPLFTDGMVHVGSTGELEYAVVPVVRSGEVVELVYAVREAPVKGCSRASPRRSGSSRTSGGSSCWPVRSPPVSHSSWRDGSRAG